ncbi:unnamed protein product [Oikopleura dioica]|uniref:Uncharacterized protein n=1 Tax=Oikopleura dioica TaxID=34765 RepID=E4XA82_OIKDI|nr:unnamed protein product [Oikopleura dioica]CBY38872.1 unnamed protein product [Oikopleura dioica]
MLRISDLADIYIHSSRAKERKISKRKGDNEESTRHEGEDLDGSSSPTSAVSDVRNALKFEPV